ncbi:OmpH family outer membrane protein [Actibacterium lipolyticum]|uniref:Outer membrane protein (OmpH-like) n=1 Tax=Actibacterium lipolyticum TaxID=1524263 RepID=A0A238JXT7_9RHOB|nr:OmpH family outer membrane protein [Actibacterium lipolyticum]SMX34954.1 Outer membrane protein (OmpH-like) [Actibacterium lipolyticum]
MLRKTAILLCLGALLNAPLWAQEAARNVVRSPIVTVDQERLFSGSAYGAALLEEIERATADLSAENRKIEAELLAEERELTQERGTMSTANFRVKAATFDEKVVAIRKAQDDKTRALAARRDTAQKNFYQEILPILTDIVRERGAVAVLESRAVILSADSIDITAEAITRIDARHAERIKTADEPAVSEPQD